MLTLQFFAALRGPSWKKGVEVAVFRGPPWIRMLTLQFFAALRGPSRPFAALRGRKVLKLPFFAALRGPSWKKGVEVAVLRAVPWLNESISL